MTATAEPTILIQAAFTDPEHGLTPTSSINKRGLRIILALLRSQKLDSFPNLRILLLRPKVAPQDGTP